MARRFVEREHRLPFKAEVQKEVTDTLLHPGTSVSKGMWADSFKEAGLSSLPRKDSW
jgi:hypothetical protein